MWVTLPRPVPLTLALDAGEPTLDAGVWVGTFRIEQLSYAALGCGFVSALRVITTGAFLGSTPSGTSSSPQSMLGMVNPFAHEKARARRAG